MYKLVYSFICSLIASIIFLLFLMPSVTYMEYNRILENKSHMI